LAKLLYFHFCFPGTAGPGFHMPPFRGWIIVVLYSPRNCSSLAEMLREYLGGRTTGYVFPSERGTPLRKSNLLRRSCSACGSGIQPTASLCLICAQVRPR
jgi:hypothetical protein